LKYAELVKCDVQGQIVIDLDMVSKPVLYSAKDYLLEKAELEKEALGFYLQQHPIQALKETLPYAITTLQQAVKRKGNIQVFVQIRKVRQHRSKKGDLMCFIIGLDETMEYDFVIMPNLYAQHQQDIIKGNYVYIEGSIDDRDSCLVKKMVKYNKES
jgi:DNA polymerase-3 subunit alpha